MNRWHNISFMSKISFESQHALAQKCILLSGTATKSLLDWWWQSNFVNILICRDLDYNWGFRMKNHHIIAPIFQLSCDVTASFAPELHDQLLVAESHSLQFASTINGLHLCDPQHWSAIISCHEWFLQVACRQTIFYRSSHALIRLYVKFCICLCNCMFLMYSDMFFS